ncbi:MAG: outer membrane protein assembly factor BamE [Methylococcales symbiont of Iophon sp. n. MRB-2018]|nr:MAG: outer membrane protein assembly factor BamE [Methylococcales symbiont of Iophon sp. n. MRB-2018]
MKKQFLLLLILYLPFQIMANESELVKEIIGLKNEVYSQNKRIQKLEKLLITPSNRTREIISGNKFSWHKIQNWGKIKWGMSREQVEFILDKPTKIEVDSLDYVTLYYQGKKSGSGYISGNIVINADDRVTTINKPVM